MVWGGRREEGLFFKIKKFKKKKKKDLVTLQKKKRISLQCTRPKFNPWVGKIPWRRRWQPTPAFLPGEFYGQRILAGYSPIGWQRVGHD